jgi:hypothetical protein
MPPVYVFDVNKTCSTCAPSTPTSGVPLAT